MILLGFKDTRETRVSETWKLLILLANSFPEDSITEEGGVKKIQRAGAIGPRDLGFGFGNERRSMSWWGFSLRSFAIAFNVVIFASILPFKM